MSQHTELKSGWLLLGPAFVAAIAYVDPGNVAANVSAGAQFGFLLVWVIVAANAMACLVQYLSAKLGLVSGLSLPEAIGGRMSRRSRLAYWVQAELVAMATDLAEVMGGAIALYLLFDLPLLTGGVITGVVSLLLLVVKDRRGQRTFERVITGLLMVIAIGFLTSLFVAPPPAGEVAAGLLPMFDGPESVLLAAAMLGATVMPHAVYLHSGLARDRHGHPEAGAPRRRLLRITRWDVGIAMILAGAVNLSMLLVAATNLQGRDDTDSIEGAHAAVRGRPVGRHVGRAGPVLPVKIRYLTPLFVAACAALTLAAAPVAAAQSGTLPQCTGTGDAPTAGGTATMCASPGNVSITATPTETQYLYPWSDDFYGPALMIGGGGFHGGGHGGR